jgi:hypothetical protein
VGLPGEQLKSMSGNSFSCNEWSSLLPETDNTEQVILQILSS